MKKRNYTVKTVFGLGYKFKDIKGAEALGLDVFDVRDPGVTSAEKEI